MGMELLQGLADDIGGSFNIDTKEDTYIEIIFKDMFKHSEDVPFHS